MLFLLLAQWVIESEHYKLFLIYVNILDNKKKCFYLCIKIYCYAIMKFTISKDLIQKTMQHVGSAIDPRGTVPILSYIKVTAADNKLFLVATNLDTEASDSVECVVAENGSLAIPTSTINEIIKKLPNNAQISFDASEKSGDDKAHRLVVSAGRSKFEVNSLSDSDFPSVFGSDFDSEISIKAKDLLAMIKVTMFAMSNKPERYNLNGLLFHTANEEGVNNLCAIATDGHRLSFAKSVIESAVVIPNRIIPRKSITELSRILPDYDQNSDVIIKFGANKAIFAIGTLKYITKLLDADFPDYNRVIPKGNNKILEINRDNLMSALERVSVVYKMGGARGVKFLIENDKVNLTSSSGFGDIADEDVESVFSEKEKFETSYNPDFIIDALNVSAGEKMRFSFSDTTAPMLIHSDNANFYHVVMPMRF